MGKVTISDFYCTRCGRKGIPIPRSVGKEREGGHLKKLYCIYCKKETNMVEIRGFGNYTKEMFELERKYGNFDENGNRKLPLGEFRSYLNILGVL